MLPQVKELIDILSKLPNVGSKSATKLVYYLLQKDKKYIDKFANSISNLNNIKKCINCNNYSDSQQLCEICQNQNRDKSLLCIVKESKDIDFIEQLDYNGLYHIIGNLISPIDNIYPKDLFLENLTQRIGENHVKEVIFAIPLTIEGQTTSVHIKNLLKEIDIKISTLSVGLSMGASIGESDKFTLKTAFENRINFK